MLRIRVEASGREGGMVVSSYKPSLMSCGPSGHLTLTWTSAQSATTPKTGSALTFSGGSWAGSSGTAPASPVPGDDPLHSLVRSTSDLGRATVSATSR